MIDEARCEKALDFLIATDNKVAVAKANMLRFEYLGKMIRARIFKSVIEGSVEARKATAEVSPEVQTVESDLEKATIVYEYLKARRATASLLIEVWRSLNAARRQGHV